MKKVLFCIAISSSLNAQFQEHRIEKKQNSLSLEAFGLSPYGAINYERVIARNHRGFTNLQIGFGVMSYKSDDFSIPHALTYNYWINRRNFKKKDPCSPHPSRVRNDYFLELGYGQTVTFNQQDWRNFKYMMPLIGFRIHFNRTSNSGLFFKFRFTPNLKSEKAAFFGVALGKVLRKPSRFADKPLD